MYDTSNYDENDKRPLPICENKKVIGLFKNELGGRIMKEFCALRAKTYSNLMDDNSGVKKSKGTKICVKKRELMFENYKDCWFNDNIILKSQQRFKSGHHNVYTEKIDKISLSSNDDERLQTSDSIKTYPYGTNAFKVCESEMLMVKRFILQKIITKINICLKNTGCLQRIKTTNFDNYANENKTKHNKNRPYIPGHPYRILIIGGSGSGKTNLLLNLIKNQGVGINHFNDPKAFIKY